MCNPADPVPCISGTPTQEQIDNDTRTAAQRRHPDPTVDEVEHEHIGQTVGLLAERSVLISRRIAQGRLAIVGVQYALAEGEARLTHVVGDVGQTPPDDR